MKKNALKALMLSFCLILLSAVVLNSCREEFIAANYHREKNITLKRLTKKDLDTNPKLSGKLSKLNALPSVNGVAHRTYTNIQNGFTVETDEFVFIENGDGVKTYTFKIDRSTLNTTENAPLENLVLTEISGDSLKAEIWKYDQKILNKQNPTENDAKNYITISSIGNLGSNEVFGKLTMYDCMDPVVTVVTTPGSMCSEGYHTWTQFISGVKCIAETKPTPDQYDVVFTMNTGPCKDMGGGSGTLGDAGGGYGGGSSTPYPGGGGSMPDLPGSDNDCVKMKNNLNKAKEHLNDPTVKAFNNIVKSNIANDTYEKAFYFGTNSSGMYQTSNAYNGSANNVSLPNISTAQFTPRAIVHNHPGDQGYTAFSPTDIRAFHYFNQQHHTIKHFYANGSDGSMYVFTIENLDNYDTFAQQFLAFSLDAATNDWYKWTEIYKKEEEIYQYFIDQGKTEDVAYDLTIAYLLRKYNSGISMSKRMNDNDDFHPIDVTSTNSIDINGNPTTIYNPINPCNL